MYFESSYFLGEEREGFYIKPMMKRVWAAQMEVLHQVDIICKRHNISYWADWGTLLGAVRHKGYIPWDDDIDIGMLRSDYMRFMHFAKKELPKGYNIRYARDSFNTTNLVTQVLNSNCINYSSDFLEKFHGSPYAVGIDIFVYDNLPLTKEEEEMQIQLLNAVYMVQEALVKEGNQGILSQEEQIRLINQIENLCGIKFNMEQSLKEQFFLLIDNICAMYWDINAGEVCYFLEFLTRPEWRIPKGWLSSMMEVPFENMTIPIPEKYHELLTILYGDYMTPVQGTAGHHYPVYREQEKVLFDEFQKRGLEIPESFKE